MTPSSCAPSSTSVTTSACRRWPRAWRTAGPGPSWPNWAATTPRGTSWPSPWRRKTSWPGWRGPDTTCRAAPTPAAPPPRAARAARPVEAWPLLGRLTPALDDLVGDPAPGSHFDPVGLGPGPYFGAVVALGPARRTPPRRTLGRAA